MTVGGDRSRFQASKQASVQYQSQYQYWYWYAYRASALPHKSHLMKAATKSTRFLSNATRAASRVARKTVSLTSLDERTWGGSKVRRVGVPGGIQLNTRRTALFVFKWRGTAFKSALTSWAALLHACIYIAAWQFAEYLNSDVMQDRSIEVYVVDPEVTAALAFVTSFVMAEYISFVIQRYDERLSVCIDTAEASLQVRCFPMISIPGNPMISYAIPCSPML